MGCALGLSGTAEEREAKEKSRRINSTIKEDYIKDRTLIKLLLLGAGESGKSTIVKQMKIIHTSGFDKEERMSYRHALHTNLLDAIRAISDAMVLFGIEYDSIQNELLAREKVPDMVIQHKSILPEGDVAILAAIYHDGGIQRCMQRAHSFHLSDGASYLLENIDRFVKKDFLPTEQDILHIRVETKGIIEVSFQYRQANFLLFDVGGQRNERRKWIHCFDNVTAVIFCASLSDYDMMLAEDGCTNRMVESLQLFRGVVNSKSFSRTSMLLFLNKTDLLKKKIKMFPLTLAFSEYRGPSEYEPAVNYIEGKFMDMNTSREADRIYVHRTCATDTNTVKSVFKVAAQTIIKNNLAEIGLISPS